jgi:hypothetical protein
MGLDHVKPVSGFGSDGYVRSGRHRQTRSKTQLRRDCRYRRPFRRNRNKRSIAPARSLTANRTFRRAQRRHRSTPRTRRSHLHDDLPGVVPGACDAHPPSGAGRSRLRRSLFQSPSTTSSMPVVSTHRVEPIQRATWRTGFLQTASHRSWSRPFQRLFCDFQIGINS